MSRPHVVVFDLDGTLLDTDAALAAAFVALGVPVEDVTWGHVVADECRRLGISLDDYLDAYDESLSQPFPGVAAMLQSLGSWSVCSNKHPRSGHAELARLGWQPEVAMFADAFEGPKALPPVLAALGVDAFDVLFVGDTAHDERCALDVGCTFAWAAWNPRCAPVGDAPALTAPSQVLGLVSS